MDPIAATYQRIFPGLFKPFATMPTGLQKHIRYPEDRRWMLSSAPSAAISKASYARAGPNCLQVLKSVLAGALQESVLM
jgi:hypothetical protein